MKNSILNKLKYIFKSCSFTYNILNILSGNHICYKKKYNQVIIGISRLKECHIQITGKNNRLVIGDNCFLSGMRIMILGDNNNIYIGNHVVINASLYQPTTINVGGGSEVKIGDYSLLSNNIEIHTTDYHGIYNLQSGKRINYNKNIIIGKHVWIGLRCILLKGTSVNDDCIVGAGTLICKAFDIEHAIIAGTPANILKRMLLGITL